MVLEFSHVEIIEHSVILDTIYDCITGQEVLFTKNGAPLLQLSWEAKYRTVVDIDIYEVTRCQRRYGCKLRLSRSERTQLLLQNGYTRTDIYERCQNKHVRKQKHMRQVPLLKCSDLRWLPFTPSSLKGQHQKCNGSLKNLLVNPDEINKIVSHTSMTMISSNTNTIEPSGSGGLGEQTLSRNIEGARCA